MSGRRWTLALSTTAALALGTGIPEGNAADIATRPPPETPEVTAAEIERCVSADRRQNEEYAAAQARVGEQCAFRARGLTAFEFVALLDGCISADDETVKTLCGAAVEKLRPQFVPSGVPSAAGINAAEFAALEVGCATVRSPNSRHCSTAIIKIRVLLIHEGDTTRTIR